jgi:hypothetical protein
MDSELLKQLAELNDKYLEVKAENEALKSMLKDTCDWYVELKEENEILKAKITKIRNELLASKLCNDFEVDRIFAENKAHWNNDLSESP